MIYGLWHSGSGLGNMLHRYIATRVLAKDKDVPFSMIGAEFKGDSFMKLFTGFPNDIKYHIEVPAGKIVVDEDIPLWEEKTSYYNPEFNFIEDNTIIDGEFQDERYFEHQLNEVDQWLKVEPMEMPDNVCVIGFRGGEFALFPELFLTPDYWQDAMKEMISINPGMRFEVHTDDKELAQEYFKFDPEIKVIHDIGINWRSMRYAKHAIIANSSFYILPRLLRHTIRKYPLVKEFPITIAPRYWARRNTKEWSMPQNYYKGWIYI